MSTHALQHHVRPGLRWPNALRIHWVWLLGGFVYAFGIPFVFADALDMNRDVYYGVYMASVAALLFGWLRATRYSARHLLTRRWLWAVALGVAFGAVLVLMVLRTDDATARPDGVTLVAAFAWRGVAYGIADGLLLSAFPILAVFAAFDTKPWSKRVSGKVVVGAIAMAASLAMTAAYHVGYSDFRSGKVAKPLVGDVVWSVPTLATLNPIGAPLAHATMHGAAVLHSYETDTFLPPHDGT